MTVPLLDLRAQYDTIREEVEAAVREVLETQACILGPDVSRFEEAMAAYTGTADAVGVASGTDALLLALMALGTGPGSAVVTTPFTFFATAGSIVRTGARLVLADVDDETLNLDPDAAAEALERAAERHDHVVLMPVHLYGRMADLDRLGQVAERASAAVVEDTAQALGSRRDGRMAGTVGDFGALSFFPSKNLGGVGDAGMVLCRDADAGERVRALRVHGSRRRYHHDLVGVNSRLDSIQAAVLSVKLPHLDAWNAARRERAARYDDGFRSRGLAGGPVRLPAPAGEDHVFHQYVVRVERRDELHAALGAADVASQVYYPVPLHRQPCFADLDVARQSFPIAERAATDVLALPIYPELDDERMDRVLDTIAEFYAGSS